MAHVKYFFGSSNQMAMNQLIDDLSFLPFTPSPQQPASTVPTNDPKFNYIFEFLRDPLQTSFDLPPTSDFLSGLSHDTFNTSNSSSIDRYLQSQTVNPICTIPTACGSQEGSQAPSEKQPINSATQSVSSDSGRIKIETQPRSRFRPRTEKESQESSHYIRSEENIHPGHPSIEIPKSWNDQANLIEVTLVAKDKQSHPYTIDNKERRISPSIFKENEPNSLYFHVTKEDYEQGEKTFFIEFIKSKQDKYITKDLIKARRLDQSMLRFTRFYQLPNGVYQRDEASTEYSCLMTEDYGDFTIEDVFPLYGPMRGEQKVCIELKGFLPTDLKTDLIIILIANEIKWIHQIEDIKKSRNNFTFTMPPFPSCPCPRVTVKIQIQYKEELICLRNYVYLRILDDELSELSSSSTSSSRAIENGNPSAKRRRD